MQKGAALAYASFGLLVVLAFLLGVHTLTSIYQDIGRHIRLGEIIWTTHAIPGTNLFSFTAPDFPFVNHHWLAELALYWGDRLIGLKGLIAAKAVALAVAFGLALAAAWRRENAFAAFAVGFLALFVLAERTDVRPEIASFVFLAWYLFVLYRRPASWLVWTLPLVQLLWVNSHIYFFMGPLVWVAYVAQETAVGRRPWLDRRLWVVTLLIALACFINPSGVEGALYPLKVFGNYGYSVMENKSPFFLKPFGYPQTTSIALYVFLAAALTAAAANGRRWRENLMGIVLMLVTAVLALMMVRNFPLFALCALPATVKNLDEAGIAVRSTTALAWAMVIAALFGTMVATGQFYRQAHIGKSFGLIVPRGYEDSVAFWRAQGLEGPIFNNFDLGSYLIWKLPGEPVFIDGRPEAYPAGFIQGHYIRMQEDAKTWTELSEKYGINAIYWNEYDITPWSEVFVARITEDPSWRIVYRQGGILILVRR